jgi:uncharacterized protein YpmS
MAGNSGQGFAKDFYKEIDQIKKKNCCGVWSVFIVLILIFAIIVALFWLGRNYLNKSSLYLKIPSSQKSDTSGITGKLEATSNSLIPGASATVSFSEEELAQYLGVNTSEFPLKRASLSINSDGIIVKGRTSESIFSIPLTVILKPKAEDGRLKLEVAELESGSISAPKTVKDQMNTYLSDIINKKSDPVADFEITEIATRDKYVDVTGVKK